VCAWTGAWTGARTGTGAAFAIVLYRVELHGRVITADALHTQVAHAHYLHRHGAHYVFTVKGNQPHLYRRLAAQPWNQIPVAHTTLALAHGRAERRTVQLISTVRPGLGFPHARLAARITRTRARPGATAASQEVVYAISNLPADTTAERIGDLVRGHWVTREPPALGPRRHLRRRPLPGPHRHPAASDGDVAQHRHRTATGRRRHQHRRSDQRPPPTPPARPDTPRTNENDSHITNRSTLKRPWVMRGRA